MYSREQKAISSASFLSMRIFFFSNSNTASIKMQPKAYLYIKTEGKANPAFMSGTENKGIVPNVEADNIAYRFPFKVSLFIFANVLIKYRLSTFLRLFFFRARSISSKSKR